MNDNRKIRFEEGCLRLKAVFWVTAIGLCCYLFFAFPDLQVSRLYVLVLLPYKNHQFHINIVDTDERVIGAVMDLEHGAQLYKNYQIAYNSDVLLNQSDFIFHCAGASVPKGKSRLVTCQASIEITEAILDRFQPVKEPSGQKNKTRGNFS